MTESKEESIPLSEEQLAVYKTHFDNFDLKQEGAIKATDLGTVLRACGQVPSEGWLKERMKVADPEEKGIVEWDGFVKILHLSTVQGNPDEELLEAFRRFDKGHTGVIKSSELRSIMTSLGDTLTEEEVEELIREADPMCNGFVNYESLSRTLIYGPD
ncbi:uncharacterized protein LOC143471326 [Clavelina lepadiformis]|uniref:EF-hand domain-containing protein n=1 Tax=Clavelina lepadiformis TaxID=159417 RepID=A0ABP0FG32_CLALP